MLHLFGHLTFLVILILIASVQRTFTIYKNGLSIVLYPERLVICKLDSFEYRRLVTDMIWIILIGNVQFDAADFFYYVTNNLVNARGHAQRIFLRVKKPATLFYFAHLSVNVK